jgi:heterodisulfide reductase subunit C
MAKIERLETHRPVTPPPPEAHAAVIEAGERPPAGVTQAGGPAAMLAPVQEMLRACIQCGTCSASCPNEFAMDRTPRHLWRLLLRGCSEAVFSSRTFALCSTCYTCSLRCPRGLPLTDAMSALKQIAARCNLSRYRRGTLFYRSFLDSVRRHGRVREMEFMTLYFAHLKNPRVPLGFTSLGLRLLGKGKLSLQLPARGSGKLAGLFEKSRQMETEA